MLYGFSLFCHTESPVSLGGCEVLLALPDSDLQRRGIKLPFLKHRLNQVVSDYGYLTACTAKLQNPDPGGASAVQPSTKKVT